MEGSKGYRDGDGESLLSSSIRSSSEESKEKSHHFPSTWQHLHPQRSRHNTPLLLTLFITALLASLSALVFQQHTWQHPFTTPKVPPLDPCEHATARPSWHALPPHRRRGFVKAVQRLSTVPSRLGLNTSLYDDFTYVHIRLRWSVHHVAALLPFHRYFVHVFEQALRREGGYDGPIPFWDWSADASDPLSSPIWRSLDGLGGDGSADVDGCVEDGVFARIGKQVNYTETGYEPHCATRAFNSTLENGVLNSDRWNADAVRAVVDGSRTYAQFVQQLENGPHRYLHWGIGGEMPSSSSTNDPLFFLHHAQIDRLWWIWQHRLPAENSVEMSDARLTDYAGPIWSEKDEEVRASGASLSDEIRLLGLANDVTVGDVMATNTKLLCYKYKDDL